MNRQKEYKIILQVGKELLSVCRLDPGKGLPQWITLETDEFISITQTKDELSIVCNQAWVPEDIRAEKNWRMLKIKGQLDFALVGILKRIIAPLSENEISIYTISTFDTDYVLIQEKQFGQALKLLAQLFEIEHVM